MPTHAIINTSKAAVADGHPPDDGGATLDTRSGTGARNTTTISDQTGAIDATKAFTVDASGGAGGERLGTRIEPRAATTATKDSVADSRRERAAARGSPGRLLRVLRGIDGRDGPSRQLALTDSTYRAMPPSASGRRHTYVARSAERP